MRAPIFRALSRMTCKSLRPSSSSIPPQRPSRSAAKPSMLRTGALRSWETEYENPSISRTECSSSAVRSWTRRSSSRFCSATDSSAFRSRVTSIIAIRTSPPFAWAAPSTWTRKARSSFPRRSSSHISALSPAVSRERNSANTGRPCSERNSPSRCRTRRLRGTPRMVAPARFACRIAPEPSTVKYAIGAKS